MVHVLIMIGWLGSAGGPVIQVQEFNSEETCNVALKEINKTLKNWRVHRSTYNSLCVKK